MLFLVGLSVDGSLFKIVKIGVATANLPPSEGALSTKYPTTEGKFVAVAFGMNIWW
jgi:hypothetical protein